MIASVAGEIEGGALDRPPAVPRPASFRQHARAGRRRVAGAAGRGLAGASRGPLPRVEPEFQPQALDALRQPLEGGEVAIARANHRVPHPRASC